MIRPSWESVALAPQDIELILDPKQAFGMGHHATTRLHADRMISRFSMDGPARLYQINVSDGGVPKRPVSEAHITIHGVRGDRQRNPAIHGGQDRAICLFSLEVIKALQAEGHSIAPGSSGENFTVAGVDWPHLKPGDWLSIENVRLEIVSYTVPCVQNARWFLDGAYSRISHKKHPGWSRLYARVLTEGIVRTGDPVKIEAGEAN